jgi:hypothetical protein
MKPGAIDYRFAYSILRYIKSCLGAAPSFVDRQTRSHFWIHEHTFAEFKGNPGGDTTNMPRLAELAKTISLAISGGFSV